VVAWKYEQLVGVNDKAPAVLEYRIGAIRTPNLSGTKTRGHSKIIPGPMLVDIADPRLVGALDREVTLE